VIYVFAAGNGKKRGDNCGCDPLVSSIYSIAVATCSYRGKITEFSERCASVMVTTYSGNVSNSEQMRVKAEQAPQTLIDLNPF
jgi:hypothetical protein